MNGTKLKLGHNQVINSTHLRKWDYYSGCFLYFEIKTVIMLTFPSGMI